MIRNKKIITVLLTIYGFIISIVLLKRDLAQFRTTSGQVSDKDKLLRRNNTTTVKKISSSFGDQLLKEYNNHPSVRIRNISTFQASAISRSSEHIHSSFYDASLFNKHPLITKNKNVIPDICVTLLSCKRVRHLRKTLRAIILYFAKIEPTISYEIAILDNGSDQETIHEILNDYPIDIVILRRQNLGIAEGLDVLFRGACRSPFILSLEDDWEARTATWSPFLPVMAMSMHVLMTDPLVLEIWLRDWPNKWPPLRNRSNWLLAPPNPQLLNGQPIMYRRLGRASDSAWAGYTNGASLKHREKLLSVGYMKVHQKNKIVDFDGEYQYSQRVLNAGLTSAHLCLPMWQRNMKCNMIHTADEPNYMIGLFAHLGGDGRSPGHADFRGLAEP